MLGIWATKNEASSATGEPWQKFEKHLIDYRSKVVGKSTKYFIPFDQLTEKAQKNLKDRVEDLPDDDVADIVEGILGDISQGSLEGAQGIPLDLDSQIQEATLHKIRAQTRALDERMQRTRKDMFNDWSTAFFTAFQEAFTKVKNELIDLKLSEEQLKTLQEKISQALQTLQVKLDFLEQDFLENGKEIQEDDKTEDDLLK